MCLLETNGSSCRKSQPSSPCSATASTTAAVHQQAAGAETAGAEPVARSGSWGEDKKRERVVVFTRERALPLGLR